MRFHLSWPRVTLAVALGLAGLGFGFAASLAVSSGSLGMIKLSVSRCTAGSATIVNNLVASAVVSVTVYGLPSTCGGATAQAAVNNGTSSSTGTASVPAAGGSVTVTLAVPVAALTTQETDVLLTGP